ncbi:MAG: class I SAM-dependent methyltransferase [Actinomycetota bacterium]
MPAIRAPEWVGDTRFRLAGEQFACGFEESTEGRLVVCKPRPLVEKNVALLADLAPRRVFELGISQGGSVAVNALSADPELLVAVEISETRIAALDELIERRGLGRSVRLHYGTDQADRARIAEIADREADGAPYDLVLDDASHWLDETRASFETLFPRLRPGGTYIIEDWNWQLRGLRTFREFFRDAVASGAVDPHDPRPAPGPPPKNPYVAHFFAEMHRVPLERFAVELVLAQSCSASGLASVQVDRHWITIVRGPAELDPDGFRVADCYADYDDYRQTLATPPSP